MCSRKRIHPADFLFQPLKPFSFCCVDYINTLRCLLFSTLVFVCVLGVQSWVLSLTVMVHTKNPNLGRKGKMTLALASILRAITNNYAVAPWKSCPISHRSQASWPGKKTNSKELKDPNFNLLKEICLWGEISGATSPSKCETSAGWHLQAQCGLLSLTEGSLLFTLRVRHCQ